MELPGGSPAGKVLVRALTCTVMPRHWLGGCFLQTTKRENML